MLPIMFSENDGTLPGSHLGWMAPLVTARLAAGLSVERAAARAGLSARTVYNAETYRHVPTATTRRALADALGQDESVLFPNHNDVSRPVGGSREGEPR